MEIFCWFWIKHLPVVERPWRGTHQCCVAGRASRWAPVACRSDLSAGSTVPPLGRPLQIRVLVIIKVVISRSSVYSEAITLDREERILKTSYL